MPETSWMTVTRTVIQIYANCDSVSLVSLQTITKPQRWVIACELLEGGKWSNGAILSMLECKATSGGNKSKTLSILLFRFYKSKKDWLSSRQGGMCFSMTRSPSRHSRSVWWRAQSSLKSMTWMLPWIRLYMIHILHILHIEIGNESIPLSSKHFVSS